MSDFDHDRSRPEPAPRVAGRLAALVAVAVGVPIVLAYAAGAMQIPRIDDWAFSRVAYDLYSTGHFRLIGWGEMTMIGHELWGLPWIAVFGRSTTALHWAGATAAALGLVGTFALYRHFLSLRLALFGTAAIAVLPAFAVLSTTYMTDLTSYAGEAGCLVLGVGALSAGGGRRERLLLAGSLVVGFWAFSCRESSLAAPLAVVLGDLLLARRGGRSLRRPIVLGVGLLAAAVLLYAWRKGLPYDQSTPLTRPGLLGVSHTVLVVLAGYFTVALGVLPVLLPGWRRARSEPRVALGVLVVGVALVAVGHYPSHEAGTLLEGNAVTRFGFGGPQHSPFGERGPLLPLVVWLAINLLAVAAGALLAGRLWAAVASSGGSWRERLRLPRTDVALIVIYALLTAVLLAVRAVERGFLLDRYFLSMTMALGLLALLGASGRGPVPLRAGAVALGLVALLSLLIVRDANSYDSERWEAARAAVAAGVPAGQVSAGFEWVGAHHRGPIPESENILGVPDRCVLVGIAPLHDGRHVLTSVRSYGPLGGLMERHLWIYRAPRLCG